jgi:lipopolysaccharide/colanic/teichoic acid biosynthesis glycosyltransferase
MYRRFGKRAFDLAIALPLLIGLSPLILLLALLVRSRLGAPVFFRQQRPGLHGRPFTMVKFRTMTDARDAQGTLLPNADRLTPFGLLLRKSSLDELPELWNVVRGHMSLVGPRPLLMKYLPLYSPEQARRHEVRPGMTGWAQVNGRNALDWPERFELDVWYVDHLSLGLDLRTLVKTVMVALRREGISPEGQATMQAFRGNVATDAVVESATPGDTKVPHNQA